MCYRLIWPAIIHPSEFIDQLSKDKLFEVPIELINPFGSVRSLWYYLGKIGHIERLGEVTLRDFIYIDPESRTKCDDGFTLGPKFIKKNTVRLMHMRQRLVRRGFTVEDGAFFKWMPLN